MSKLSIEQSAQAILACPAVTFSLEGPPGVGKTHGISAHLREAGYTVHIMPCQNIPAEDTAALPVVKKNGTVDFATPEMWHPAPKTAFILDELWKAPDDILNAFLPMVHGFPRTYMHHEYPEDTIVVVTGNAAEFRVGDKFKPHMGNRVVSIEVDDPTLAEATQVMLDRGVDARIIEWVRVNPQALKSFDPQAQTRPETELMNYYGYDQRHPKRKFCSMRSLELASNVIKSVPEGVRQSCLQGAIGQKAASNLEHFLRESAEFIPLADMVDGTAKVPKQLFDRRLAAITAASGLDESNWKQLLKYAERLGSELKQVFLLNASRKKVSADLLVKSQTWRNELAVIL